MGIFGQSTPFDADIEKATSETNTNENWSLILDVCDKVSTNPRSAKECLKAVMKRMAHADPHVVMQAITLLDACANNCGKTFHLEIASREFENEFKRLLKAAQPKISLKMRQVLKNWAENDFKNDPELNLIPSLYQKLRQEGYEFSNLNEKPPKSAAKIAALKDPNVVSSQQEEEDIAKAIELSLKEAKNSPQKQPQQQSAASASASGTSTYPSLYPSFSGAASAAVSSTTASNAESSSAPAQPEPRKVRALYDFEAAEENELTFFSGEFIHVTDDTDPNWWKGYNQRGDGLFPSNFVTADLSVDPDRLDINQQHKSKKNVQFEEEAAEKELQQKTEAAAAAAANQPIEIDETKVDRLLHLLHEANPEDPSQDTEEMLRLEQEVHQMGPLIDAELERVDRKHAQLTQLSVDLVDAINLYHSLMRDDRAAAAALLGNGGVGAGGYMGNMSAVGMPGAGLPLGIGYQPNPHMLYGAAGYTGAAGSFPTANQQLQHNYAAAGTFGNGGQMPMVSNAAPQHTSSQLPQNTAPGAAGAGVGYGSHQMHMIPMQYQNGGVSSAQLNGALTQSVAAPISAHMYASGAQQPGQQQQPTTPQQHQQHNYQMLPPQQQSQFQQQQQQLQTNSANPTVGTNDQQQQHPQHQQQQHMQAPLPQPQQQFMTPQTHAYMQQQHQQHPQQQFLPMPNGPTSSYMLPPSAHTTNNNNNNNPQHHQHHPQHSGTNDFTQLQQQMAAMSMAANAAAAINQPVTQNFLVQNEPKNNIPIYQQQR